MAKAAKDLGPKGPSSRKETPPAPDRADHPTYSRDELERIVAARESWTEEELAEAPRALAAPQGVLRRPTPGIPMPTCSTRRACARATTCATSATPAGTRSPAARSRRCTAAGSGRCASSPASARPSDTNARFKYLLAHGMTGLSTAFDMPDAHGLRRRPPAAPRRGRARRASRSRRSRDMELLFDGIPLGEVTTSMTINATGGRRCSRCTSRSPRSRASRARKLGGTLQNDMLKEFIAQKEWIVPPAPAMRIVRDMIEFCAKEMPRWNTVSISGYHIREAGATAVQELAFTLADGIGYVQECVERGLDVDDVRAAALASSGTSTTTSSRRSRSSARRAGSGRAS